MSNTITLEPDDELMNMSASMDNRSKDMMIMLAHLVNPSTHLNPLILPLISSALYEPTRGVRGPPLGMASEY
jgi:hypothetical protein